MPQYKLKRSLFMSPHLEVISFLPVPTIMHPKMGNPTDVNLSVLLNLSLIIRYTTGNRDSFSDPSTRYVMTIKNYRKTRQCFAQAIRWFEDINYSDIFYYTENGRLEFNLDKKDIRAVVELSKNCKYSMEIRPTIIEDNMGRHEGASVTLNYEKNTAFLDWEDFVFLADVVLNFDFEKEACLLLSSLQIGLSLDTFTTPDEVRKAREISLGSKPSPFNQS